MVEEDVFFQNLLLKLTQTEIQPEEQDKKDIISIKKNQLKIQQQKTDNPTDRNYLEARLKDGQEQLKILTTLQEQFQEKILELQQNIKQNENDTSKLKVLLKEFEDQLYILQQQIDGQDQSQGKNNKLQQENYQQVVKQYQSTTDKIQQNETNNKQLTQKLRQRLIDQQEIQQRKKRQEEKIQEIQNQLYELETGKVNQQQQKKNQKLKTSSDSTKIDQKEKINYDYKDILINKENQQLRYIQHLFAIVSTDIECCQHILFNKFNGLKQMFNICGKQKFSKQLLCFYDILADMLALSNESRNFYYKILNVQQIKCKKFLYDKCVNDGQFMMCGYQSRQYNENKNADALCKLLYADQVFIDGINSYIVTGFTGSSMKFNMQLEQSEFILNKLFEAGVVEFLRTQYITLDKQFKQIPLLFYEEIFCKSKIISPFLSEQISKQMNVSDITYNMSNKEIENYINEQTILDRVQIQELFQQQFYELYQQVLEFNLLLIPQIYNTDRISYNFDAITDIINKINIDAHPLNWNLQYVKMFVKMVQSQSKVQISQQNLQILQKLFKFFTGECEYFCQPSQCIVLDNYDRQLKQATFSNQFNLNIQQSTKCIFSLNQCSETDKIIQIMMTVFNLLCNYYQGSIIILNSDNFFFQLKRSLLELVSDKPETQCYQTAIQCISLMIGHANLYQRLIQEKIIDQLINLLIKSQKQYLSLAFIQQVKLSTQYYKNETTKCSYTAEFQKITQQIIKSTLQNKNNIIRYGIVYHLGILLKQRKLIKTVYNLDYQNCICQHCVNMQIQYNSIMQLQDMSFILKLLAHEMQSDKQPEIRILTSTILEEFLIVDDQELIDSINLSELNILYKYLQGKMLRNNKYVAKLQKEQLKVIFSPSEVFINQHNIEYNTFTKLSHQRCSEIKDKMYQKVFEMNKNKNDEFSQQSDYMYDTAVLPHFTKSGQQSLMLNNCQNNQDLKFIFSYQNAFDNESLPLSYYLSQFYPGYSRFEQAMMTEVGQKFIIENNLLKEIEERLYQYQDENKLNYRGYIILFSYYCQQKELVELDQSRVENLLLSLMGLYYQTQYQTTKYYIRFGLELIAFKNQQLIENLLHFKINKQVIRDKLKISIDIPQIIQNKQQDTVNNSSTNTSTNSLNMEQYKEQMFISSIVSTTTHTEKKVHTIQSQQIQQLFDCTQYIPTVMQPYIAQRNPISEKEKHFSKFSKNKITEFPPLIQRYDKFHRATMQQIKQYGIIPVSEIEYQQFLKQYYLSQEEQVLYQKQIEKEKAQDFQQYIVQSIAAHIPEDYLLFSDIVNENTYKDTDKIIYSYIQDLISQDEDDKIQGMHDLTRALKGRLQIYNQLLQLYIFYVLAEYNLTSQNRKLLIRLMCVDTSLNQIIEQIQQQQENVLIKGFLI